MFFPLTKDRNVAYSKQTLNMVKSIGPIALGRSTPYRPRILRDKGAPSVCVHSAEMRRACQSRLIDTLLDRGGVGNPDGRDSRADPR